MRFFSGLNEFGEGGWIVYRFNEEVDEEKTCMNAFKNYFCWLNFPRCDDEDESLVMCRSACENLHLACGVSAFWIATVHAFIMCP